MKFLDLVIASVFLTLATAQYQLLPSSYNCDEQHLISLNLPFPVPDNTTLIINTTLTGDTSLVSLSPSSVSLGPNATQASFTMSISLGHGQVSLAFTLNGSAMNYYLILTQASTFQIVCPQLDPATPTWWAMNSPWIVPVLITIGCVVTLSIIWWRRRLLAKAALSSVHAVRRALASVIQLSNVEMSEVVGAQNNVGIFDSKGKEVSPMTLVNTADAWEQKLHDVKVGQQTRYNSADASEDSGELGRTQSFHAIDLIEDNRSEDTQLPGHLRSVDMFSGV